MPLNSIFSWYIKKRLDQIEHFKANGVDVQHDTLLRHLEKAKDTSFGKNQGFDGIRSHDQYKERVPLMDYEQLKPYVDRMFKGEKDLLWPGETKWFAKSSGTTSDRSKFIPVTKESLEDCHYAGGKDLLCQYYHVHPNRKLYKGKHLVVGGSAEVNYLNSNSYHGDLSAIILKNMPWWAEIRRVPRKDIALMSEWDEKIERLAQTTKDEDVYIVAGVPSWTLVLMERILEITGAKDIREVWPNLELFMHGGVNFGPYREEYKRVIPHEDMNYVETYNASEGFFGIQDQPDSSDLLLMLDYGIYYEFIPMSDFKGEDSQNVLDISQVETDTEYAVVISTNGGLWRYILGDTIRFTELNPFRFRITGRTKSFINAFGEEVVVENAERAVAEACSATGAQIRDYSAGPIYLSKDEKGGHEWCVEFIQPPSSMEDFTRVLDTTLKELNSDYAAKRSHDLTLLAPTVHAMPHGTFDRWLRAKGRLGGQNKVPRLSNNRDIIDAVLEQEKMKTCA